MLRALNTPDHFKFMLGQPAVARHGGFAVHVHPAQSPRPPRLSTGMSPSVNLRVDDLHLTAPCEPRLGCVVPKRLARRAVTRVLVKRLARQVALAAQAQWPQPLWWVLRLTAPIRPQDFPSARSQRLKVLVREDLERVFALALVGWRRRQAGEIGGSATPRPPTAP